jgi:hypothetical protein
MPTFDLAFYSSSKLRPATASPAAGFAFFGRPGWVGSGEPSLAQQQQPQKQDDHNHDSDFVNAIHIAALLRSRLAASAF